MSSLYPVNLRMKGRSVTVIGGGKVAKRKIFSLLEAEAKVILLAPDIDEELETLAEEKKIIWQKGVYAPGMLGESFLAVLATDDEEANERAAAEAKSKGMLVHAPTRPELSDFFLPSCLKRGDFLLTVSTGGKSPAFAKAVRKELEEMFPVHYGHWLERLDVLRREYKGKLPPKEREDFWRKALSPSVLKKVRDGDLTQAEVELKDAFSRFGTES